MKKNIIINALGISDSGGITVLEKALLECSNNINYTYRVLCFDNDNILALIKKFESIKDISFIIVQNLGFIHRLYYENFTVLSLCKKYNISLIYNFSGSNQFFSKIPTLVKVQNLMYYSRKLDDEYKQKYSTKLWLKHIFLKRILFLLMLKNSKNIEIQSIHVQNALSEFLDITDKKFFLKNDFPSLVTSFAKPRKYDFSKKMIFLYVVGPHFEYPHKNIKDFVAAMLIFKNSGNNFEIKITLDYESLNKSEFWSSELNEYTTFLGYLKDKNEIKKYYTDNTLLISTSIVETIGLHVIEATQSGVLAIVPDEPYSREVYGDNILKYQLSDTKSLVSTISNIYLMLENEIQEIIKYTQEYILENERKKNKNIVEIFDILIQGEKNV